MARNKRTIQETQRGIQKRNPRPVFLIVSNAKETETAYFESLQKTYDKIIIKPKKKPKHTDDYYPLVEETIQLAKREADGIESDFHVWCVFDADVDYNTPGNEHAKAKKLTNATALAKDNNINVALSTPCFELWLLLHFTYTAKKMPNPKVAEAKLMKAADLQEYKKDLSGGLLDKLSDKIEVAINHANRLKNHQVANTGKTNLLNVSINPYTNVWEILEAIQTQNASNAVSIC